MCDNPTLKVTKTQVENGLEALFKELNRMRRIINTTHAFTEEETKKRLVLIERESYLRDFLYTHFDIQQYQYSDKTFVRII
jgi:hypothetical protein